MQHAASSCGTASFRPRGCARCTMKIEANVMTHTVGHNTLDHFPCLFAHLHTPHPPFSLGRAGPLLHKPSVVVLPQRLVQGPTHARHKGGVLRRAL